MQISGTQINPTEIIVENDTAKELMGMFPGLITDNCPDCGVPHANESICHSCEHIYCFLKKRF